MFTRIANIFRKGNKNIQRNIQLTKDAILRLNQEIEKRGENLRLEVKVVRDRSGKGVVQVGFNDGSDLKLIHPEFGQIISESDFKYLAGGELSFDEKEGSYLYFPNIDLEWQDTPRKHIKRIIANRDFTSGESVWTSDDGNAPSPIQKILVRKDVISCYAKGNMMQIEFREQEVKKSIEEEISEDILIYFAYLYPRLSES